MASNKSDSKGVKKMVLTAGALIGTVTLLSHGILQAAASTEYEKAVAIPAAYANGQEAIVQSLLPEGYQQANYAVGDIDLEYYQNQQPTSKDMTKEEAAEIGVRALWNLFGVDMEGQLVEMGYQPATENAPRSSWHADVMIDGELSYSFSVDSVTGELLQIARAGRTLDEHVSVAFDAELDRNPQEFIKIARELAEKHQVVQGEIVSVAYNGQGYSNNDPSISFDIIGENDQIALMTLSRHDKALLGISYPAAYKAVREYNEKLLERVQKKVEELEQTAPQEENEAPVLRVIE